MKTNKNTFELLETLNDKIIESMILRLGVAYNDTIEENGSGETFKDALAINFGIVEDEFSQVINHLPTDLELARFVEVVQDEFGYDNEITDPARLLKISDGVF